MVALFKDILVAIGIFCIAGYFVWVIYEIIYALRENEENDDD